MASDGPARKYGLSAPVSRRTVLGGLSLLPLVAVNGVPLAASADPADVADAADTAYLYLSPHQAAVLDAATRRLIPGPEDAPSETSPGAHEANVVRYIDIMLCGVLLLAGRRCTQAGRGATAPAAPQDFMADFVPLDRAQNYAWQQRITNLRSQYTTGIALLDQLAGGDFSTASTDETEQHPDNWSGGVLHPIAVRSRHRGDVLRPGVWRQREPRRLERHQVAGRQPAAGLHRRRSRGTRGDICGTSGIIGLLVRGGWAQAIGKMGGKGGVNA